MHQHEVEDLLRRYTPLDLTVRNTAASFCFANPDRRLEVALTGRMVDGEFLRRTCLSADGAAAVIASRDRKLEGRQLERIYAFDGDGILLGVHEWEPGDPGTPGALLAAGRFSQAVDYALLTHREWLEAGSVPAGVPEAGSAYTSTRRAELEITIFGGNGVPLPRATTDGDERRDGAGKALGQPISDDCSANDMKMRPPT